MGTRNLTMVQIDNEIKVAQYGQWDGYPCGTGDTIVDFLKNVDMKKFTENVKECSFMTIEDKKKLWMDCGHDGSEFVNNKVVDIFYEKYPELSRDTGANILKMIENKPLILESDLEFAGDSLFCEWAYLINLDTGKLEIYKGFNEEKLDETERFAYLSKPDKKYQPIKLVENVKFEDLDDDFMKNLSDRIYNEEEE